MRPALLATWPGCGRRAGSGARLGFTADAGLHSSVGLLGRIWSRVSDPVQRPVVEDQFGRSLEEAVAAWAELWPFQFALAEEARALLRAVG